MTDQQSHQPVSGDSLSEAAVDGLLRDFFRLEVPLAVRVPGDSPGLQHSVSPIRLDSATECMPWAVSAAVSLAGTGRSMTAPRIATAAALASLAAGLLLMIGVGRDVAGVSGLAGQSISVPLPPGEQLLPVSSAPDPATSAVPVDEHGLLLRETDEIRLRPAP